MSSLLSTEFRLPFRKTSSLFETLYGYKCNEATAISVSQMLYEALALVEDQSEVVHFDETGLQADGKKQWVHTACTKFFCFLFLHVSRGKKNLADVMFVLKD